MFQPKPEIIALLEKLQANYRLVHVADTLTVDPVTRAIAPDPSRPGGIFCEIIDLATGEVYVKERGETEPHALENAVNAAVHAPKPKTAAQRAHDELNGVRESEIATQLAEKDAEIERLKAILAGEKSATTT